MSAQVDPGERSTGTRNVRSKAAGLLLLGAFIGLAGFAVTNRAMNYASTNNFCATACHSMQPATDAYRKSIHFASPTGVRATCSDCHIVHESERYRTTWRWLQLVAFKTRVGLTDIVDEMRGTIATPEKWESERARLTQQVHAFVKRTDSSTCRGCHELDAFRAGTMYQLVHANAVRPTDVDCLSCHSGMAHPYDRPARVSLSTPVAPQGSVGSIETAPATGGPLGDMIRLGGQIFVDTSGNPSSASYVGRGVRRSCGTCHRKAGTDLDALPLFGAAAAYPANVDGTVMTLQSRIAECFMRHLDGVHPPLGSRVLLALDAYVTSLSEGRRMAMSAAGGGNRALRAVPSDDPFWSKTNAAAGKTLYAQRCSPCHGADGEGGAGPAVWGPQAFSDGAALATPAKLTAYLTTAMAAYAGSLSAEQARDLAAFIDTQPRPGFVLSQHLPPPDRMGVYAGPPGAKGR